MRIPATVVFCALLLLIVMSLYSQPVVNASPYSGGALSLSAAGDFEAAGGCQNQTCLSGGGCSKHGGANQGYNCKPIKHDQGCNTVHC